MPSKNWFEILEICRAITTKTPAFTASDLALAAQIEDVPARPKPDGSGMTEGSKKEQIASAWLSKFVKWKYATVVDKKVLNGRRPSNIYSLTELGRTCVQRPGASAAATAATDQQELLRVAKLVDAIYDFAAKRGSKQEEESFQALLVLAEESQAELS